MGFSLRVIIADDDPEDRQSLKDMLCKLGHDVVAVARNGESLMRQCAMLKPDVVITGPLTPEMYGVDAAAAVYKSRPTPILLYSSRVDPDLIRGAEHKHVSMYLVKPICEEHLQAALKQCHFIVSSGWPAAMRRTTPVGRSPMTYRTVPELAVDARSDAANREWSSPTTCVEFMAD